LTPEQKKNILRCVPTCQWGFFPMSSAADQQQSDADQLEAAADQETELEKLQAAVSTGYARLPRDRKDWYD
jgi:hypothetical protein